MPLDDETPPFSAKPFLRYTDPTRDAPGDAPTASTLLDATVWRLGESGRPVGFLTMEIYEGGPENDDVLSYEFAALAPKATTIRHKQQPKLAWTAAAPEFAMRRLADADAPAATPAARLLQMRELVRRVAASETFRESRVECRLLPKPIDRYESADAGILDGAVFAFANGTNPEVGLLVEAGTEGWSLGAVRLTAAELTVTLDGEPFAQFPAGDFRKLRGDYLAFNHALPDSR